jgi:hypothetical protein
VGQTMNKEDEILKYFNNNLAFYFKTIDWNLGENPANPDYEYRDEILDKDNLIGAKLSLISNIFLSYKENIVENTGSLNYKNIIFNTELENAVLMIANKVNDKYEVDGVMFNSAPELVAFIRNSLAHGSYLIDYDMRRVILHSGGKQVEVNVNKLSMFVVSGLQGYLHGEISNSWNRKIVLNRYTSTNREKPLESEKILCNTIENFTVINLNIKKKDGEDIPLYYRDIFEVELKKYRLRHDINVLKELKEKYKNDYDIEFSEEEIDKKTAKYLSSVIYPKTKDLDYQAQNSIALIKAGKIVNNDKMIGQITSLQLLQYISKYKTTDLEKIKRNLELEKMKRMLESKEINLKESEEMIFIDSDIMVNSLLGMFNALFIYPFDDIYDDKEIMKNLVNTSLDYSKLDLSLIKLNNINLENGEILSLREELNGINRRIQEINNTISIDKASLEKVKGNAKAEANINAKITREQRDLNLFQGKLALVSCKVNYYDNNSQVGGYFYNKAIIEGIRNSIAHGNYQVIEAPSILDSKIIFRDIYLGKETFSCEVGAEDFKNLLIVNMKIILQFLSSRKEEKAKTK